MERFLYQKQIQTNPVTEGCKFKLYVEGTTFNETISPATKITHSQVREIRLYAKAICKIWKGLKQL